MAAAKDKPATDGISPKLQEVIQNVAVAYAAGDVEKVWHLLSKPTNGLNETLAAKFDEALAAKTLPRARELLVQARLKLLIENRSAALPAPSPRERMLMLAALQDYVQVPLDQIAGQSLLQEDTPPPENMDEFDRRFHDIHEMQAKLSLARSCAGYASDLAGKLTSTARKKLSDKEQELVAHSEGDSLKKVLDLERDVRQLELETRLLRLKYGVAVLQQQQLTREKFVAAATARQDARALQQALEPPVPVLPKGAKAKAAAAKAASSPQPPVVFHRAALSSPDLAKEVAALAHNAQESAGSLADKAEQFFAGLAFWLRGRYGWGPDVSGLAKSADALEQPELLQQVFMPDNLLTLADAKKKPKQEDAGRRTETRPASTAEKAQSTPTCPDRRHHYTWAWEDRQLVNTVGMQREFTLGAMPIPPVWKMPGDAGYRVGATWASTGKGFELGSIGDLAFTHMEIDKSVVVPPQDPRLVYRIVGFVEYAQAVQHLDKFVEEATLGEFKVAEEIIRSQEAFRLDTNLSRKTENPNPLSEQSANPRDDFSRHGLEWMLALARVELGAMLAGFTTHAEPFLSQAPTTFRKERGKGLPFGMAAYRELLMDGLRSHYWSVVRQNLIAEYYKTGVPENHLLTQSRRAIVGRQFARAVLRFIDAVEQGENSQPPQQIALQTELQTWDQTFQKLQRILLYCLTYKVGQQKITTNESPYIQQYSASHRQLVIQFGRSSTTTEQHDETPDVIRKLLLLADPALAGCECK
jgi:hypothetical protein